MKLMLVLKRLIPFLLGLVIGVTAGRLGGSISATSELDNIVPPVVPYFADSGKRACRTSKPGVSRDFGYPRIKTKPRPGYTDEARSRQTEGTVILRVTFLASGNIGAIEPIKTLPDGLTEQAVAAAQRIEFEPAVRDGKPVSVTKQVEYTFFIY